jgi:hypothetical protein
MPVHPKALFRLWCLLGLQDYVDREEMMGMREGEGFSRL